MLNMHIIYNKYILLDVLLYTCNIAEYFLRVVPYFGEPVMRVKIQTTSKNSQRYYTTKRLIRDLLSNTPNCYVRGGELREYLFTGECVTEVCEAERNWRGKSS